LSFLPARRYASAGLCDSNVSVRPSVCHAPVLCQNEERRDFFTSGSPTILVFWCQIKFHHQIPKGSPRSRASNNGRVGKQGIFWF